LQLLKQRSYIDLIRGSALVVSTRILTLLLGVFTTIIVARWYGVEATGFVALVNSSAIIFGTFLVLGQDTYLIHEMAIQGSMREQARKSRLYRHSLLLVLFASSILALPVALVVKHYFLDPILSSSFIVVCILVVSLIARTIIVLTVNASRAIAPTKVFCAFILMPVVINLTVLVIWGKIDYRTTLVPTGALASGLLLTALVSSCYILHRLDNRVSTQNFASNSENNVEIFFCNILSQVKSGIPFFIASASTVIITEGNIIIAGFFLPTTDVGVYSVAYRIAFLSLFFLFSINMIAQQELAKRRFGDTNDLRLYARKVSGLIFFTSLPLVVSILFARDLLLETYFGADFANASSLIVILLIGHSVVALTGVTNPYFTMTGGQNSLAKITFFAACLSVIINIFLTPHLGLWSPAIATSSALIVINFTVLIKIRLRDGFWVCWLPSFGRLEKAL
jgi:O-antigen/teichoic acid export membrane protein